MGAVVAQSEGDIYYAKRQEALELFDESDSNVGMSFPVNVPSSAFTLTTSKGDDGEFTVDAVSTDGGSHPRNVAIQSTMALVEFGAMTPLEMAEKLTWRPARMMGLLDKGHFTPGADADITVLDPDRNAPVMSFVAGKMIMSQGQSVAGGGTLLVTAEGKVPYPSLDCRTRSSTSPRASYTRDSRTDAAT